MIRKRRRDMANRRKKIMSNRDGERERENEKGNEKDYE